MSKTYYPVYKSSSGDVGVGTTSPTSQSNYRFLQVNGSVSAVIEATVGGTRIGGFDSTSSVLYVGTIGSYPVVFRTAVDEKMRISANGNVGIGTTSPAYTLQVGTGANSATARAAFLGGYTVFENSAGTGNPSITFNNDTDTGISNPASNTIVFTTNGSEKVRIDSSGNVGIGTSSPATKLHVEGNDIRLNTEGSYAEKSLYFRYSDNAKIMSDSYLTFLTSGTPTEKMRIASDGNVGIGSTSPSQKLDVNGTVKATSYLGDFKGRLVRTSTTQTITGNVALTIDVSAAYIHIITVQASGGTFGITGVTYNNRKTEPEVDEIILIFKWPASGSGSITISNIIGDTPAFNYGKATAVRLTSYKGTGGLWICEQIASNMDYTNL